MVYTPTVRTCADPTKHARVWHEEENLFLDVFLKENYLRKQMTEMERTTKKWKKDQRIVGPLDIYHHYHQLLSQNIHRLKGKRMIFLTGDSVDLTDPASGIRPRRIGLDYSAESSRLSTEIANIVKYLHSRYGWQMFDDVHFMYVNNVLCPFHVTKDFKIEHSLEDIVTATNQKMEELGKDARFGSTTKYPGHENFKQGISLFRDSEVSFAGSRTIQVYARAIAKTVSVFKKDPDHNLLRPAQKKLLYRLFKNKETICSTTLQDINNALSKDCYFNRLVFANAFYGLTEKMGLEKITLYSRKGSYAHDIMQIVARLAKANGRKLELDDFGGEGGTMRNSSHSLLGECDPSALKILAGRLKYIWKEEKKKIAGANNEYLSRISVSPLNPKAKLEDYLVQTARKIPPGTSTAECCSDLHFWRCGWKRKCDSVYEQTNKRLEKCAVDFARNKFSREDVAKVIEARDGKIDSKILDEKHNELVFKDLKVKGYDKPINELELVIDDCHKQGYSFGSVELDRQILNSTTDELIYRIAGRGVHEARSWIGFKDGRFVVPLPVPRQQEKEYQLRASSFTNKCHVARILGKIDMELLQRDAAKEILPNKYSVIGTARHKLANQRPWVDYMRETSEQMPKVWQYCENQIFCDVKNSDRQKGEPEKLTISGHRDASFLLTNGNPDDDIIINTDYKRGKRGAYEKPAYILQGMIYSKGAADALGREFKKGMVVHLVKRFFHGEEGDYMFPKYYLGHAAPEDYGSITLQEFDPRSKKLVPISGLEAIALNSYRIEKNILENSKNFTMYRGLASAQGFCFDKDMPADFRSCFNVDECGMVSELVAKGVDLRKYFLPGVTI